VLTSVSHPEHKCDDHANDAQNQGNQITKEVVHVIGGRQSLRGKHTRVKNVKRRTLIYQGHVFVEDRKASQ
jgi:hypothetical protein